MDAPARISVIGAGLMGHGIALTFARHGHDVRVFDPVPESLAALPERIRTSLDMLGIQGEEAETVIAHVTAVDNLAGCVASADFITEAAPEKLEVKQKIFAEAERAAPGHCLFASNTSVIPITKIMSALGDRSRGLGTHWWNPGHMIPLVEVIRTEWTSQSAIDATMELLTAIGKTPVRVEKDVPGFIGNRLQHALWREAMSLVEKGICSAEAVDTVVRSSFGRRLAVLGPLENADLIGTDLSLDIHENVLFDLESRRQPLPVLRQLVESGKLGMKSGEGFRKWPAGAAQQTQTRVAGYLKAIGKLIGE